MKVLSLFLLFFGIIKFVGSEPIVADNYHGNLRRWTIKADGKMHIGLHLLKESVKLTFPKVTRFNELLSEIKLYSPNERGKCKDANSLNFNLVIAPKNDIHGEIKVISNRIVANLFETCDGGERPDHTAYASPLIDVNPVSLAIPGHLCYDNINTVPFQIYDKDKTKYFMELQVSGNFDCQVFMEIPSYMELENIELPEFETNKLNESFAGHEEEYWWKRGNDEMLPDQISFDSEKNVKINLLNSTVSTPHFFRIGIEQPIPTFKFNFGAKCVGAVFEMYLNLKKDCHILIKLNQNGFTFSTPLNQNNNITGALSSLIFDGNQVFVKVASPLSINKYQTCQLSNPSDVPNDQFVLQMAPLENIGDCETAEIILSHSDVVDGIEVLIDRAKIVENTTENATENSTIPSSTDKSAEAKMSWWWYLIFGGIGLFIVVIAILIYIFVVRPRLQNQKKSKTPIVMIESVEDEDHRRITVDTKTAISPELKPQKVQPSKSVPPPINDSGKKLKDNTQIIVGAPAKIVTPKKSNDAKVMAKDATDKNDKDGDKNPTKSIENRTQKSVNPIKFDSNFVRSLLPASAFAAEKFYEDYPIKDDKIDLNKCPSDITITDDFWALFSSFLKADDITELERPNRKHGRQYQYQFIVRDLSKPQNKMFHKFGARLHEPIEEEFVEAVAEGSDENPPKGVEAVAVRVYILAHDPPTFECIVNNQLPSFFRDAAACDLCISKYFKPRFFNSASRLSVCLRELPLGHHIIAHFGAGERYRIKNSKYTKTIFAFKGGRQVIPLTTLYGAFMHPNITKITRVSAKNTTTTEETNVAAENKNIVTIQSNTKTKTKTIDGEDTTTAATQKTTAPTQASGENGEL